MTTYHLMTLGYASSVFVLPIQLPSNFSVVSADQSSRCKLTQQILLSHQEPIHAALGIAATCN